MENCIKLQLQLNEMQNCIFPQTFLNPRPTLNMSWLCLCWKGWLWPWPLNTWPPKFGAFLVIFCLAMTFTVRLLTPKSKRFIFVPNCTSFENLVKLPQAFVKLSIWSHMDGGMHAWTALKKKVFFAASNCQRRHKLETITRNSSGDEIANVNFLHDDIVHVLQNTIDSCINSATDRRGYV